MKLSDNPTIAYLVSNTYEASLKRAKVFQDEHTALKTQFESLGFRCEKVDWQDAGVDWEKYVCLIPKAVWNYFDFSLEFSIFLRTIQAARIPMQNPVESVLWNMDKHYLLDLIKVGKPVVPTIIYPKGSEPSSAWFSTFGNSEVLIKPSISGGSKNTIHFQAAQWGDQKQTLSAILGEGDLIIQPFVKEVEKGEYSFFFFGGNFSHAVLKKPRSGDFRAHSYFGAELQAYEPSPKEIAVASDFASSSPTPCSYARVDLIRIGEVFHLVELEIIEPYLYMEYARGSNPPYAFAAAVVGAIS